MPRVGGDKVRVGAEVEELPRGVALALEQVEPSSRLAERLKQGVEEQLPAFSIERGLVEEIEQPRQMPSDETLHAAPSRTKCCIKDLQYAPPSECCTSNAVCRARIPRFCFLDLQQGVDEGSDPAGLTP